MFFIYQTILTFIILVSPIIIIIRIFKRKEDKKRFLEKFSFFSKKRSVGKLIWFHGASVGEIFSIIPIIEKYEKDKSINKILITSSTLSSSFILKNFKFKKTIHQFYPIDHIFFTNKFLNYWKPTVAIFIESEIWPSMFRQLKTKQIPLVLLNARLSKKTYDRWMLFKNFTESTFSKISIAYPQNLETKVFLKKLKINKINLLGNLKFAENNYKRLNSINESLKTQFKKKKIWVASSTHANEEIFCAKTHIELKKKYKNLMTIMIPRHIHRVKEIISDINNLGLKVVSHSSNAKNLKNVDVYIVDTFGETNKFYKVGSSVFLGGSLISRGGQNPLEPARYDARIFHGPNIDNFKDVYKLLAKLKISKKITTPKELASLIYFNKKKGAGNKIRKVGERILKKTIKEIDKLIINEFKKT